MPKVTQEYRDARRREIAGAALRVFARQGFQASSMADIIAESGLSAGAIYGHYKSKEELVHSSITDLLDLRFAAITGAITAEPIPAPGDMMLTFLNGIESQVGQLGLLVQVWGQAVLDPTSRIATDGISARLIEMWRDYLVVWFRSGLGYSDARAQSSAATLAPVYLGIMQGYIVQSAIVSTFDREAYLAAASALLPA